MTSNRKMSDTESHWYCEVLKISYKLVFIRLSTSQSTASKLTLLTNGQGQIDTSLIDSTFKRYFFLVTVIILRAQYFHHMTYHLNYLQTHHTIWNIPSTGILTISEHKTKTERPDTDYGDSNSPDGNQARPSTRKLHHISYKQIDKRYKLICNIMKGHVYNCIGLVQADNYQCTVKEVAEYDGEE